VSLFILRFMGDDFKADSETFAKEVAPAFN
jgi:hypothetical protein